jgi:hypothetical protein
MDLSPVLLRCRGLVSGDSLLYHSTRGCILSSIFPKKKKKTADICPATSDGTPANLFGARDRISPIGYVPPPHLRSVFAHSNLLLGHFDSALII